MAASSIYRDHKLNKVLSVDSVLSVDYISGPRQPRTPHLHADAWELAICLQNTCLLPLDNKTQIELLEKQAFFIRPGTIHDISIPKKDGIVFAVTFTCSAIPDFLSLGNEIITVSDRSVAITEQMVEEVKIAFLPEASGLQFKSFHPTLNAPFGTDQVIECCLEMLILICFRDLATNNGVIPHHAELQTVINNYLVNQINQYIADHLTEELTVESIAKQFHYSRSRLSRLYKAATGKSLKETILELRISLASYRLRTCKDTVSTAAECCGFGSPQYFSRVFTNKVGISPSKFRSLKKEELQEKYKEKPDMIRGDTDRLITQRERSR